MKFKTEISYFNSIYEQREKYDLEWAFKNAQQKIDNTYIKLCEAEKDLSCTSVKDAYNNQNNLNEPLKRVVKFSKESGRMYSIFAYIHQILSLIEIIMSVLLVMFISNLSHQSEALIESEVLSVCVVIIFALFKVFIERKILQPKLIKWGWKAYRASYIKLFNFLEQSQSTIININSKESTEAIISNNLIPEIY